MVSNTRSVFFGLMLSAAQLSSASPAAASDTAFSSPIYPTATDSIPALPSSTDECLAKCNAAHDKCNTAPDANHATCAAEWAECLGYNPYDGPGGSLVEPTACAAHTTMASATGKHTGMETSKPASTEASKPAKSSEPAVVVNGAGSLSGKLAGLAGAIGAAAVALL
ncbi:hypothetical protein H9Q69_013476 [Fusarium xylarioides]|uniref:Extracellular membrane protein CFEM domain-containing protein n=1 Tax=Fusarium xylarioides TaxID=221167 RepID=A0A9P7KZX7_9HYPO|nr:hypothetical protein H9Q70_013058 [Fusarium xylarioides]KAG5759623.1 hypothetical protein H9Q72_012254 [Fusarium xylarioides]KAG5770533.1 hypothetical protein H9Q73_013147 [Fusarium xylarioides]KAG5787445.1 hypothetical protein H9Q69_013476 [Fusarium xylarioides]